MSSNTNTNTPQDLDLNTRVMQNISNMPVTPTLSGRVEFADVAPSITIGGSVNINDTPQPSVTSAPTIPIIDVQPVNSAVPETIPQADDMSSLSGNYGEMSTAIYENMPQGQELTNRVIQQVVNTPQNVIQSVSNTYNPVNVAQDIMSRPEQITSPIPSENPLLRFTPQGVSKAVAQGFVPAVNAGRMALSKALFDAGDIRDAAALAVADPERMLNNLIDAPANIATGLTYIASHPVQSTTAAVNAFKNSIGSRYDDYIVRHGDTPFNRFVGGMQAVPTGVSSVVWDNMMPFVYSSGLDTETRAELEGVLRNPNATVEDKFNAYAKYYDEVLNNRIGYLAMDSLPSAVTGAKSVLKNTPYARVKNSRLVNTAKATGAGIKLSNDMTRLVKTLDDMPLDETTVVTTRRAGDPMVETITTRAVGSTERAEIRNAKLARILEGMEQGMETLSPAERKFANKLGDLWQNYYKKFPEWAQVPEWMMAGVQYAARVMNEPFEKFISIAKGFEDAQDAVRMRIDAMTARASQELGIENLKAPEVLFESNKFDASRLPAATADNTLQHGQTIGEQLGIRDKFSQKDWNKTGKQWYDEMIDVAGEDKTLDNLYEKGIQYSHELAAREPVATNPKARRATGGYANNKIHLYIDSYSRPDSGFGLVHEAAHWIDDVLQKSGKKKSFGMSKGEDFVDAYLRYKDTGMMRPEQQQLFEKVDRIIGDLQDDAENYVRNLSDDDFNAQAVITGINKALQGDLRATMHIMSQADETAAGQISRPDRYYGKMTPRRWGLTDYDTLAREVQIPDNIVNEAVRTLTDSYIIDDIVNGRLFDNQKIADTTQNSGRNIIVDRNELVNNTNLPNTMQKVLDRDTPATPEALNSNPDNIAIDRRIAQAIIDTSQSSVPVTGLLGDAYKLARSSMLAAGSYIGGNIITGIANVLTDSGFNIGTDIKNALRSGGTISDSLGLRRRDKKPKYETKIGNIIGQINEVTGAGILRNLDRTVQNFLAETTSQAALRRRGIPNADVLNGSIFDDSQLASDVINEARTTALLAGEAILPRPLNQVLSVAFPFLSYQNAAVRSTFDQFARHPLTTTGIWNNALGRSGYQAEMENRRRLGVVSDEKFTSFKLDPTTGRIRQGSIEYTPLVTAMKSLYGIADITRKSVKGESISDKTRGLFDPILITDLANAARGQNRYGSQSRISSAINLGGNRRQDIRTGKIFEGGTPAEIIATGLRGTIGGLTTLNRTVLPSAATIWNAATGDRIMYYQPYADRLFGSFERVGDVLNGTAPRGGGDFTQPRSLGDVLRSTSGYYERDYYPERPNQQQMTERELRNMLWRQQSEQQRIRERNYGRYIYGY